MISVGVKEAFNEEHSPLKRSGLMIAGTLFGLWSLAAARYKIILGEDYIERVEIRRVRIPLAEITEMEVLFNQARIYSAQRSLHISGDTENFSELTGSLLRIVENRSDVSLFGDRLIIDDLLQASEPDKGNEHLILDVSAIQHVELIKKSWLKRHLSVQTQTGTYEVTYDGRGMGYESVLVDGHIAKVMHSYLWYAPEFRFQISDLPCIIKVRVWPWLTIRSFTLEIAGTVVYKE